MIEGAIFSVGFCIFFVVTFLVLQASRLEECFKKGKIVHIRIAYFMISFVIAFLITYGFNYLVNLFKF
ncbi:MAG: DUF1146 family protein [Anaeroplasmataceae bacterium]|nr:DUF1146 family protein [Anaeroplasmataceae bacterium]MDE6414858.1 DUF1146 family protein [Anaeroplasmataceae bacterium]